MKKIRLIVFAILFCLFVPIVDAGSFSASSTDLTPTVGNTIKINVNANSAAGKFTVSSSNSGVLSGGGSSWIENGSGSFSFTAKSAGSATVTITATDVSDSSSGAPITGSKTITINVKEKASNNNNGGGTVVKKSYVKSSINYLKSLSVEGVVLSPEFNKDTTEYEVTLDSGTTSINVNGEKESNVSYVTGLGNIPVSEGVNFISIVVTAENGAKRTYNIKATVLEESPIIVNVSGIEKTLLRKADGLPNAGDYYTLSTVKINDVDIPAYVNETSGYTLVGLKDSEGNVSLYRYSDGSYYEYKEFGFGIVRLGLLEPSEVPKGYTIGEVTINEKKVNGYIKEGSLPLLYGINIETGEKNFYSYDSSENTIQKFVAPKENPYSKYYPYIIIGVSFLALFEFIVIICIVVSKNKKLKKILRDKLDVKTEFEKSLDNSNDDENLGHTALISKSVSNVYDNAKNKKDLKKEHKKKSKKNSDDDMFHF